MIFLYSFGGMKTASCFSNYWPALGTFHFEGNRLVGNTSYVCVFDSVAQIDIGLKGSGYAEMGNGSRHLDSIMEARSEF